MPDRLYVIAEARRFRSREHILAHPYELATSAVSTLCGLMLLVAVGSGWEPSIAIATLPDLGQAVLSLWLLIGGPLVITGILWRGRLDRGLLIERAGLLLLSVGWAGYACASATLRPGSLVSAALPSAFVAASLCRFAATWHIEHTARRACAARRREVA